eukprot:TRINITY_DN3721_c0_g1_i1.p1 TRINITY_DN3721_c0_g1~~TRINITY_DN3721_c0_g1_i1.p1  ORF type:complete len:241 (+),score=62.22 TRINITY_DN3721_c0_g1_i1:99-821(+)
MDFDIEGVTEVEETSVLKPEEKEPEEVKQRKASEEEIRKKENEIVAMKDRLYDIRFDSSLSREDQERAVKNLLRELKRLESNLHALRQRAWLDYEASLRLDVLGLGGSISAFTQRDPVRTKSKNVLVQEPPDQQLEDIYNGFMTLKMMRTKSTATLEDQTPSQKWQSLFKMFKEWKHNTTLAEARQILNSEEKALRTEQIAKCRAAIMSIQNQKTISKSDELLLQQLRYKLRKLSGTLEE